MDASQAYYSQHIHDWVSDPVNGSDITTAITAGDMFIDALMSCNELQTVEKLPVALSVALCCVIYCCVRKPVTCCQWLIMVGTSLLIFKA